MPDSLAQEGPADTPRRWHDDIDRLHFITLHEPGDPYGRLRGRIFIGVSGDIADHEIPGLLPSNWGTRPAAEAPTCTAK
jgi:hypothetical protein